MQNSVFKMALNENNDPKGRETIICTLVVYKETANKFWPVRLFGSKEYILGLKIADSVKMSLFKTSYEMCFSVVLYRSVCVCGGGGGGWMSLMSIWLSKYLS